MTTPDKEVMPTDIRTAGDFWAEKRDGRWQLQMRHRGPGSSFCVAQINHWADNPEALTTRIADACNAHEPMREALEKVMVGGNHLGLIIGVDHPPYTASHEEARAHYADAIWTYEAWCCWKTIMEARPALSTLPVNDRHTSDDVERLREALRLYDLAITEAEAIMCGEYALHYGVFFDLVQEARAALKGVPQPASEADAFDLEAFIEGDNLEPGKLRPCPFCGGEAERIDFDEDDDEPENVGGSAITCKRCKCSTAVVFGYKETLVSSWNERAPANAQPASEAGKLSTDEVL